MSAEVNTKLYHLRLLERVAFYDDVKTNMFWDSAEGWIVIDPKQIEMLESRGAPTERVETS